MTSTAAPSRRLQRVAGASLIVTVAAMIATPLFDRGGEERRVLANVVVLGLLGVGVMSAWLTHGWRALYAAVVVGTVTFGIELLGSSTGVPFGAYDYTDVLWPRLAGVPLIVAAAWTAITLIVFGIFQNLPGRAWQRVVVMAGAITAWDVFLDPQMVGEGYWRWETAVLNFRGIPAVNYAGWFVTALLNSLLVTRICGAGSTVRSHIAFTTYATLAVLSSIGFLFFFDDVVVAVTGAVAMGTFVVLRSKAVHRGIVEIR